MTENYLQQEWPPGGRRYRAPYAVGTAEELSMASYGTLAVVLSPLSLWVLTPEGWEPLASLEGATLPAVGNHNLFSPTHPDVAGTRTDGSVLVWRPTPGTAGLYVHELVADLVGDATETASGVVEEATTDEVQAGTAGALYATVAKLKAEITRRLALALTPEAVRLVGAAGQPAFRNGWVNFGGTRQGAGFYKDPLGRVHLSGTVKNGSSGAVWTLPAGYRPGAMLSFTPSLIEGAASGGRVEILASTGEIMPTTVSPAELSLNGISFRAAQQ